MALKAPVRIILGVLGLVLFAGLIWRVGPANLADNVRQLGWGFLGLIGLGGMSHLLKTWAWRWTFPRQYRTVPYIRLVGMRLAGEAVGQLTFAGQLMGETTRAVMLRGRLPGRVRVSSVVLDRSMFTFTSLLLAIAGTVLASALINLPQAARRYNFLIAFGMGLIVTLGMLAVRRRWPFLSGPLRALGRRPRLGGFAARHMAGVSAVEEVVYDFYQRSHSSFRWAFALNLGGHLFSMMEVYLVLWLLGLTPGLAAAFIIEALTKVVNFGGAFIPGNLGASEGGNMLILQSLGLGAANGLTLAVARRLRGLSWAAVGLAILYAHGMRAAEVKSAAAETE